MFNTDIDTLNNDSVTDLLVNFNTDSIRSDIPNLTSLTDILTVRHTTMDGTVALNINIVTNVVDSIVSVHVDHAVLTELTSEGVSSFTVETVGVSHNDATLRMQRQ